MKLRTRIALVASVAVAVGVVLASIGAYFATRNELRNQVDESLIEVAEQARGFQGLVSTLGAPGFGRGRLFEPRTAFDAVYVQALLLDGVADDLTLSHAKTYCKINLDVLHRNYEPDTRDSLH